MWTGLPDIVTAATKQNGEEQGGEKLVSVSHSTVPQYLTLLDYMGQRGFEYSDITAASTIHTAVRNLKQFTITTDHYKSLLCNDFARCLLSKDTDMSVWFEEH
jgi:hypothetical protein